ncbi:hypothetical protein SAMN05428977_103628 [Nitrosomonas sp. Nm166]|nr:hypothetical protein SAMN05428977_103628 [Nitrosomonas sp. Nm166]
MIIKDDAYFRKHARKLLTADGVSYSKGTSYKVEISYIRTCLKLSKVNLF